MNDTIRVTLPPIAVDVERHTLRQRCERVAADLAARGETTVGSLLNRVAEAVEDEQRDPRDSDLWHVQVTVTRPVENGWTARRSLPTMTLDGAVLGIENYQGASQIAADILLVDVQPEDWTFMATIRQGNSFIVYTSNLRSQTLYPGDHVSDVTERDLT